MRVLIARAIIRASQQETTNTKRMLTNRVRLSGKYGGKAKREGEADGREVSSAISTATPIPE
jgi:hypothetical protein